MNHIVQFDYATLDTETRITVKQRSERIKERNRLAAQNIWENGRDLYEAQQELAKFGSGTFLAWVQCDLQISHQTAYNMIRVYTQFDSKTVLESNMAAKTFYLLAAPSTPEPARLEAVERAKAGEEITHAKAKAIVASNRPAAITAAPPATPTTRTLTNEEAEAVVWRVLAYHCPAKKDDRQADEKQLAWLQAITISEYNLFRYALNPGIQLSDQQIYYCIGNVEQALEKRIAKAKSVPSTTTTRSPAIVVQATDDIALGKDDSDEYYTPLYVISAARKVLGTIDLDPASCETAQSVVLAKTYLNKFNNGLRLPWLGRVWLNPPFSNPAPFTNKLIEEYERGNTRAAIVLVNNGTDTAWGQALLRRYPVCFVGAHSHGSRISFWRNDPDEPRTGNRYAQMFFYLGDDSQTFAEVFSQFGVIKS